jgi:predicted transcriptional regulator
MMPSGKLTKKEGVARLEAFRDQTDAIQMRLDSETKHQEKIDAWIADMNDGRK